MAKACNSSLARLAHSQGWEIQAAVTSSVKTPLSAKYGHNCLRLYRKIRSTRGDCDRCCSEVLADASCGPGNIFPSPNDARIKRSIGLVGLDLCLSIHTSSGVKQMSSRVTALRVNYVAKAMNIT